MIALERGRGHADGERKTTYGYDDDRNQTTVTAPGSARSNTDTTIDARVTARTFDGRGLPWTETTGAGDGERTTVTEYDGEGNLTRVVNPAGVDPATGLPRNRDPGGAPTATSDWNEHATVYTYDADNLLTEIHLPFGRKSGHGDETRWFQEIHRDSLGRVDYIDAPARIGQDGRRTTYGHLRNGWISSSNDSGPDTPAITYDYDRQGNQTTWTAQRTRDAEQHVRKVTRSFWPSGDLRGRVGTRATDGNEDHRREYRYGYDRNGSMTRMIDVRPPENGESRSRLTTYEYDALARQTRADERWENEPSTPTPRDTRFTYDDNGNTATRLTDGQFDGTSYAGGKTTTFSYDEQDREATMTVTQPDAPTRTTASVYWPSDQIRTRERTRAESATTVRDERYFGRDGRLTEHLRVSVDGDDENVREEQAYEYDDAENTSTDPEAWGNGRRSRDERGRHVFNSRGQLVQWNRTGQDSWVRYTVNGDGAITAKLDHRASGTETTTDYCFQPTTADCANGPGTGDRLIQATATTGSGSDTTTYEYDLFGEIRSATNPSGTVTYTHDPFERMTGSRGIGQAADTAYEYDALDRRDLRRDGDNILDYSYVGSSEKLSREARRNGSSTKSYDYNSELERVGQGTQAQSGGDVTFRAYATDGNGSVSALENADGAAAGEYTYDPYGELTDASGEQPTELDSLADTPAGDNPFRFQGFYQDDSVGSYDVYARQYAPDVGRFLSADRYQDAGADFGLQVDPRTNDRYVFVGGNPVDHVEFDGHVIDHRPGQTPPGQKTVSGGGGTAAREYNEAKAKFEFEGTTAIDAEPGSTTATKTEHALDQAECETGTGIRRCDLGVNPNQAAIHALTRNPPTSPGEIYSTLQGLACAGADAAMARPGACTLARWVSPDDTHFDLGRAAGGEAIDLGTAIAVPFAVAGAGRAALVGSARSTAGAAGLTAREAAEAGTLRNRLRSAISAERGEFDPSEFLKKKFPKEETTARMGDPREAREQAAREVQKHRDVAGSNPSAPTGGSRLRRGLSALFRLFGQGIE